MLGKLKYLIIDDSSSFLALARSILVQAGISNDRITATADSHKALRLLHQTKYDVVLCDYNMNCNIDGGLILDEVRQLQLQAADGVFLCVTGDNTRDVVNHFIEMEPDDYLTKPFRYIDFVKRLTKVVKRKQAMKPILQALAKRQHQQVLDMIHAPSNELKPYRGYLNRIHGDCLLRLQKHQQAVEFFQSQNQKLIWPKLGLSQALQGLGRFDEAEVILKTLLNNQPNNPQIHRDLATCIMLKEEYPRALSQFEELNEISPANPLRQVVIANLCSVLGHYDQAAVQFEKYALKVKGSHRYSLQLHIHSYQCLIFAALNGGEPQQRHRLLTQAKERLLALRNPLEQPLDSESEACFAAASALIALLEGNIEICFALCSRLQQAQLANLNFYTLINLCTLFGICGMTEEFQHCVKLASNCCEKNDDDDLLVSQIKLLKHRQLEVQQRLSSGSTLAESCLTQYQGGQFELALKQGIEAFFLVPFHHRLSLALLELLALKLETSHEPNQLQAIAKSALWVYLNDSRPDVGQKRKAQALYQQIIEQVDNDSNVVCQAG